MTDSTGHPAWQELLKDLPESLHPIVTPVLKKWDEGVTERLNEVKKQYEPFQEFIDNEISKEDITQGLGILYHAQNNPLDVINNLNEAYNLGYIPKDDLEKLKTEWAAENSNGNGNPDPDWDEESAVDITKHPDFIAMQQTLNQMSEAQKQELERRQKEDQQSQIDKELKTLKDGLKDGQHFDDTFILTLMAAGIDGEKAVERYNEVVNQAAAQIATQNGFTPNGDASLGGDNQPPVIMGVDGTAGSGTPDSSVNFGQMPESDIKKTVMGFLEAQENS